MKTASGIILGLGFAIAGYLFVNISDVATLNHVVATIFVGFSGLYLLLTIFQGK